jgi:hypothetical protein
MLNPGYYALERLCETERTASDAGAPLGTRTDPGRPQPQNQKGEIDDPEAGTDLEHQASLPRIADADSGRRELTRFCRPTSARGRRYRPTIRTGR